MPCTALPTGTPTQTSVLIKSASNVYLFRHHNCDIVAKNPVTFLGVISPILQYDLQHLTCRGRIKSRPRGTRRNTKPPSVAELHCHDKDLLR